MDSAFVDPDAYAWFRLKRRCGEHLFHKWRIRKQVRSISWQQCARCGKKRTVMVPQ